MEYYLAIKRNGVLDTCYYSALKKNEVFIHATIQMDPENMLKERNCPKVPCILYIV